MRFRPELIIGIVLILVTFAALFLVANILNPPPEQVLFATRDIQAGEALSPALAQIVEAELPFVDSFVLESDLEDFQGAVFVEAVHQNQPIHKASLVQAGNPAASSRTSLALDDPNLVAFVVPVSAETSPQDVREGDHIDLTLGVGSATFLSGSLAVVPTPNPFEPREVFVGGQVEVGGQFFLTPVEPSGEFLPTPVSTPTLGPTQPPQVTLPIAKTLVRGAMVMKVIYEERPNPGFGGEGGEAAFVRGDIRAIVVAVPRASQEIITFALANGEVRVSLRSPLATDDENGPTMGMSWDDLVAFYYAERDLGLLVIDPGLPLTGPGASVLYPTQQALLAPTATPTRTPPPTETPTATSPDPLGPASPGSRETEGPTETATP